MHNGWFSLAGQRFQQRPDIACQGGIGGWVGHVQIGGLAHQTIEIRTEHDRTAKHLLVDGRRCQARGWLAEDGVTALMSI
jgi:hypothetical protein